MAERTLPVFNVSRSVTNLRGDQIGPESVACGRQAREAFERLESVLLDGLRHGFFEIAIVCQLAPGGKRQLTIRAGKSYQFTIPENEIPH
jgi:hypothetical protein